MSNGGQRQDSKGMPFAGQEGRFFGLQAFQGINTKANRAAIGDQEFTWLENIMPIGDGNARALGTNGASIYTASVSTTIVYVFYFNVGTTQYAAVFQSDGTAYQVNTVTSAVTTISATVGRFYGGGTQTLPACAQWGSSGILIVSKVVANAYWAWDGATLFSPGSPCPVWLDGTGGTTMPTGIAGTCIELFQSRVWIGNGANTFFSAPTNGASFAGATGGGSFASTDPFLRVQVTAIKQSAGFLYIFGDSSINSISNVQTAGAPPVTTFNNQNIDSQAGTPWPNSVQSFGRGLVFANQGGIFTLFGGAAEKASDNLDGIFNAQQAALKALTVVQQPSAAAVMLFSIRCYMLMMPIFDLFTNATRNVVVIWDGKKWFLGSQDLTLSFIAGQEINSVLSGWGTDGTLLFPLFTGTSLTLRKLWQSKFWAGDAWVIVKQCLRSYLQALDNSGLGYQINATIDCVNENKAQTKISQIYNSLTSAIIFIGQNGAILKFTGTGGAALNFSTTGLTTNGQDAGAAIGCLVGVTMQSKSQDFTLIAFALLYKHLAPIGA